MYKTINLLSEKELIFALDEIKNILDNFRSRNEMQIIFLNLDCLCYYLEEYENTGSMSFMGLVDIIEPFIPVSVADPNVESYLLAATSATTEDLDELEKVFLNSTKTRFIVDVLQIQNEIQWQEIKDICKTIRNYRENGF